MSEKKGIFLVLCTAFVSGFSIFLNSFAVKGFNPFAFAFLKNAVVAVFLLSLLILLKDFSKLKQLKTGHWKQLASIGLIGGSIPFLLFFYALKLTTSANAGFFHKTLFIWASLLALFFLKEKISHAFIVGVVLLFVGNFLLFGPNAFGFPEALVLIAAILWAAENVLSKHVLKELSGTIVAFGRMFFGSVFILAFLALTGQLSSAFILSMPQLQWVFVTSFLLFLFVFTYYSGLKHLPVHKAASLLLLAQPITAFLSFAFLGKSLSLQTVIGFSLIVVGAIIAVGFTYLASLTNKKGLVLNASRT